MVVNNLFCLRKIFLFQGAIFRFQDKLWQGSSGILGFVRFDHSAKTRGLVIISRMKSPWHDEIYIYIHIN